jgi:hypothetical protein
VGDALGLDVAEGVDVPPPLASVSLLPAQPTSSSTASTGASRRTIMPALWHV